MTQDWRPEESGDDALERLFAEQREAWRGELHRDVEAWRAETDATAWRGDIHLADWPESSAGPEYWMYRREAEGW